MTRLGLTFACLGVALLALNLYGLTTDYRVPAAAQRFEGDRQLTRGSLLQRPKEPDDAYFVRLASSVRARMASHWRAGKEPVALSDNYVLHVARFVVPSYQAYEFTDARRALRRGYGLCSQDVNIVFDVLRDQGFRRRAVLLPHHSILAARSRHGLEWILDANFGIVIPHSLAAVQARPSLVRRHYEALAPRDTPLPNMLSSRALGDRLVSAYADRPIAINETSATPQTTTVEPLAYIAKWMLPAILLVGAGACLFRRKATPAR